MRRQRGAGIADAGSIGTPYHPRSWPQAASVCDLDVPAEVPGVRYRSLVAIAMRSGGQGCGDVRSGLSGISRTSTS